MKTILIALLLTGCSTLTTPLRDCKSMCGGKVEFFQSQSEGTDQHCKCRCEES